MRKTDIGTELPPDTWSIYPIFHFDAPWERDRLENLDLDVRLIRADEACLRQLQQHCDGVDVWDWMFHPQQGVVRWLLALRVPEAIDHVPSQDIGMSIAEKVEDVIAASFVLCLKVLRSVPAVCPLHYFGEVEGSSVNVLGHPPWEISTTADAPRCDWPEQFEEQDLWLLPDVWSGIVNLRRLERWTTKPFQETFFATLDNAAKEMAQREMRSRLKDDLAGEQLREVIAKICEVTGWDSPYGEAFRLLFKQEEDKMFNVGTRIGRAVGIFEEGVHLPHLHAFLSACLVLETLFTIGEGEVTHKLATRLAKVVGDEATPDERRALYGKAKKVYNGRSEVVHGKKMITEVSEEARRGAFELAREALRKILANKRYLDLYTAPVKKEGEGVLYDFFIDLDLG